MLVKMKTPQQIKDEVEKGCGSYCRICGKMFRPIGNAETLCDKCYYISQRKNVRDRVIRGNMK
jgi:hypothetical protein